VRRGVDQSEEISNRFTSLNPYSFGGTILKIEDVNYIDSDPAKGISRFVRLRHQRETEDLLQAIGGVIGREDVNPAAHPLFTLRKIALTN